MFATLFRLLPLAAAAYFSTATSMIPVTLHVASTSPTIGESSVAADTVITLRTTVEGDDGRAPERLALRTTAGTLVPGHTEISTENDQRVYRFFPDAPLAPDHYFAYWDEAAAALTLYDDARAGSALYSVSANLFGYEPIFVFSTVHEPEVRFAVRDSAAGVYAISFSEDMDVASLAAVRLVDGSDRDVPAVRTWIGGDLHELQLTPATPNLTIYLPAGVASTDLTPIDGLPLTEYPFEM